MLSRTESILKAAVLEHLSYSRYITQIHNNNTLTFITYASNDIPEYISSLKINLGTGEWSDILNKEKGHTFASLLAYLIESTEAEAIEYAAELLGIGYA